MTVNCLLVSFAISISCFSLVWLICVISMAHALTLTLQYRVYTSNIYMPLYVACTNDRSLANRTTHIEYTDIFGLYRERAHYFHSTRRALALKTDYYIFYVTPCWYPIWNHQLTFKGISILMACAWVSKHSLRFSRFSFYLFFVFYVAVGITITGVAAATADDYFIQNCDDFQLRRYIHSRTILQIMFINSVFRMKKPCVCARESGAHGVSFYCAQLLIIQHNSV